jgi:hypothetical protein
LPRWLSPTPPPPIEPRASKFGNFGRRWP